MNWMKLSETKCISMFAGSIFRFPAKYPYEDFVDYMLVLDNSIANPHLKLVVTTGYKSGSVNIICVFPKEAYVGGAIAISSEWLKRNWSEWIYPDCEVEDVYISTGYDAPSSLPG